VRGCGFNGLIEPDAVIDCGNSGTSIRLLAGLLAGRPFHSVLTGDASITRRPMARVVDPLRAMGARIDGRDGGRLAPLAIRGGGLTGVRHELAVASAQVKTALLLAASRPTADRVIGRHSAGTTRSASSGSGARLEAIPGGVRVYPGLTSRPGPGRAGTRRPPPSSSWRLRHPGSDLVVEDVCLNPTRIGFVDVLRRMGATVEVDVKEERGASRWATSGP